MSIALAFLFTFFSFYINYQYSLHITNISPKLARVDFQPEKSDNGKAQFKLYENGKEQTPAGWMKDRKFYGYTLQNETYKMTFTLKALKDCKVNINLRGPFELRDTSHKEKGRIEHWIYFYKLIIDGKNVLKKPVAVWHDQPYKHSLQLKAGEEHIIKIRWQKLPFRMWLMQIDWCYFVILLTVYFFVSYKLFFYLTKLKTEQKRSLPDIVFAVLFFALLLIPAANISDAEKSAQENRMLAKKSSLFINGKFNPKFGADFEKWFNDRFNTRDKMMALHNRFILQNNTKLVANTYCNKEKWCWDMGSVKTRNNNNLKNITELNKFYEFLKEQNIKFYLLIVPDKIDIYSEYTSPYKRKYGTTNEELIRKIIKQNKFPVIYPLEALREAAKKDFVFFKTDHHWTEWGAYIGYQQLMKALQKDFPEIKIATEDDYKIFYDTRVRSDWRRNFHNGQTFERLKLPKDYKFEDVKYKYYTPKKEIKPKVWDINHYKIKHFNNKEIESLKVMEVGTSMNENFLQFTPYSFNELKYFRLNGTKNVKVEDEFKIKSRFQKDISEFKPDIFILVITTENLWALSTINSPLNLRN